MSCVSQTIFKLAYLAEDDLLMNSWSFGHYLPNADVIDLKTFSTKLMILE